MLQPALGNSEVTDDDVTEMQQIAAGPEFQALDGLPIDNMYLIYIYANNNIRD